MLHQVILEHLKEPINSLSRTTAARSGLGVLVNRRRRGEQGEPESGAGDPPRELLCFRTAKSWSKSCASCLSRGRGRFKVEHSGSVGDRGESGVTAESRNSRIVTVSGQRRRKATASA